MFFMSRVPPEKQKKNRREKLRDGFECVEKIGILSASAVRHNSQCERAENRRPLGGFGNCRGVVEEAVRVDRPSACEQVALGVVADKRGSAKYVPSSFWWASRYACPSVVFARMLFTSLVVSVKRRYEADSRSTIENLPERAILLFSKLSISISCFAESGTRAFQS